jgi:hypothetical protein
MIQSSNPIVLNILILVYSRAVTKQLLRPTKVHMMATTAVPRPEYMSAGHKAD